MGQIAKDWAELKTIISQKDDAIERQATQIAALQKELSAQQPLLIDSDDVKAVAELRQTVGDNTPATTTTTATVTKVATTPTPTAPATTAKAAVAVSNPAAPAHPPVTPVTTFKK